MANKVLKGNSKTLQYFANIHRLKMPGLLKRKKKKVDEELKID